MVENGKEHRQNSHLIIYFPTSEGVSEVSGASERANGRASGPVLQSVFLAVFDHSAFFISPEQLLEGAPVVKKVTKRQEGKGSVWRGSRG